MKKNMSRVLSVILVLVMVLSMTVTVFAQTTVTYDGMDYSTGEPVMTHIFTITADTIVERDESLTPPWGGMEFPVLECEGKVIATVLSDMVYYYALNDFNPVTCENGEMYLPEGYSSYDEWYNEDDFTGATYVITEPGIYLLSVMDKEFEYPIVLDVKESAAPSKPVTPEIPSAFSDIPDTHYAHDAIMEMVGIGMFKGATAPDANGVATFNARGQMKYGEFLAVMTRLLMPDVENDFAGAEKEGWMMPYYYGALAAGILYEDDIDPKDLGKPMTREEMAKILVRTGMMFGSVTGEVGYTDFPDIYNVGDEYFEYVAMAYGEGLLCGVDSKGTFNPKGTLSRADAALVCYRLLDYGARVAPK